MIVVLVTVQVRLLLSMHLSYSLFGQALTNIKKDNLINKTNSKNMLVTIDFDCEGQSYRIERGRKPNVLKFYINDTELESKDDNSQGDSRETQNEIERLLNMSHDMFKHIVALNTYTEPFLSMRANDQRNIIEQLLGITMLSDKAESLKEQVKQTKDAITQEEYRIKAVADANKRIEEQIAALVRRQTLWQNKKMKT
jgi:DNA repair exonuclease SbcCD ATPase subunit